MSTPASARGVLPLPASALLDAVEAHLAFLDPHGTVLWANAVALADAVGPGEVVGRSCQEVWRCADGPCHDCPVRRAARTGRIERGKVRDHLGRTLFIVGQPVFDEHHELLGVFEQTTDITAYEEDHQARHKSESKFRLLADRSPSLTWVRQGRRLVYANQACLELMEQAPEAVQDVRELLLDLLPPSQRQRLAAAMDIHDRGGTTPPQEYTFVSPSGHRHQVICTTRLVQWDGHPAVLNIAADITCLKLAERALRESEERYRTLVETSPDGIILVDLSARILMANDQMAQLLGYADKRELLRVQGAGRQVVAREDRSRLDRLGERLLGAGGHICESLKLSRRDGSTFPAEVSAAPLLDEEGEPYGFIGIVRDRTEAVQAEHERLTLEAQVHQAQKLESLGMLASGIAHDFNNLLVGVLGHATLAGATLEAAHPSQAHLEGIQRATGRASQLTRQLLAYAGGAAMDARVLDLSELVRDMGELLRVGSSHVELRVSTSSEPAPVSADPGRLEQVVLNLLTNAVEAPGVQEVRVRAGLLVVDAAWLAGTSVGHELPSGTYASVQVTDDGAGMEEAIRQRIFDPFFTTKPEGSGLGLATTLGVVRSHGGAIRVDSAPGQGTTFTVILPLTESEVVTFEDESSGPWRPPSSERLALVVDDEETVRETVALMLEQLGWSSLTADGGEQALQMVREHEDIQVVLLDLTMPRMSGVEVAEALIRIRPDLPIVPCSGYSERELVHRFGELRMVGFLQKPFSLARMAEVLERAAT